MSKTNIKKMVALIAVAALVIGGAVVMIVTAVQNEKNEKLNNMATVSVDRTQLKEDGDKGWQSSVVTEVKIQFESCAIPVGTVLQMVAMVSPADTKEALLWKSSDTGVAYIDKAGKMTVKGSGTAVITATLGTVSDTVVVEGLNSISQGSEYDFPVYTGDTLVAGKRENEGTDNSSTDTGSSPSDNKIINGNSTVSSNPGIGQGSSGGSNSGITDTELSDRDSTSSSGTSGSSSGGGNSPANSADNVSPGNISNSGSGDINNPSEEPAIEPSGSGVAGTDAVPHILELGFTQRESNVYVCYEGGVYYGEIITEPNVAIIYIKNRSGEFDAKIQSVLAVLLPDSADTVWNNYVSASSDRTFTVEGRMVRIVAAPNGGHSQIVVYN